MTEPVLIIGAGPVGLSLALALLQKGIPVVVYEVLSELSPQDRASTFHPPVLAQFERWGILQDVLAHAQKVTEIQYWERDPRRLVAAFDFHLIAEATPYPYRLHYPQQYLTRLLQPMVDAHPNGAVHFEHRLTRFVDQGDHITATFKTPKGEHTVRGSYLCAADGLHSEVRQQLGITFNGKTETDRFLLINSDARFEMLYPNIGLLSYVFDPSEWVIIQRLRTFTRLTFRLTLDEDAADACSPHMVYQRVERFAPSITHNIKGAAVYQVQQRVADTFRQGRVMLLGDAAHVVNPVGGMGLNGGVMDAAALADVLAQVYDGADESLFDTYSQTRREAVLKLINPASNGLYADMTADEHHAIASRNDRFQELATDLNTARQFLLKMSMIEA